MRCAAIQGLTEAQAKLRQKNLLSDGATVELIPEGGGMFTLAFCFPDAPDPHPASSTSGALGINPPHLPPEAAPSPTGAPGGTVVVVTPAAVHAGATVDAAIGALSREFESNGRPAAIGRDRNGGFSYGQYQIACGPGTMAGYLKFLDGCQPALCSRLQQAGGAAAAAAGSEAFQTAWRALAADPAFVDSQHAFIAATHYQPFATKLKSSLGLDLALRSSALRDVAWSVAVQHGADNSIFDTALRRFGSPLPADDAALINAIYDERSRVDVHFSRSTKAVQDAVAQRFIRERALALAQCAPGGTAMA